MSSRRTLGPVRLRRPGAERGFTLVEALVSLAVLGMAVVVVLEVSSTTLRTQSVAQRHLEAIALADARLNEIAVLSADSLERYIPGLSGEIALSPVRYTWHASVRRESPNADLWRAAVVVAWSDGDVAVETLFYRPGRARLREGTP